MQNNFVVKLEQLFQSNKRIIPLYVTDHLQITRATWIISELVSLAISDARNSNC
jgi:hypothetical protein